MSDHVTRRRPGGQNLVGQTIAENATLKRDRLHDSIPLFSSLPNVGRGTIAASCTSAVTTSTITATFVHLTLL